MPLLEAGRAAFFLTGGGAFVEGATYFRPAQPGAAAVGYEVGRAYQRRDSARVAVRTFGTPEARDHDMEEATELWQDLAEAPEGWSTPWPLEEDRALVAAKTEATFLPTLVHTPDLLQASISTAAPAFAAWWWSTFGDRALAQIRTRPSWDMRLPAEEGGRLVVLFGAMAIREGSAPILPLTLDGYRRFLALAERGDALVREGGRDKPAAFGDLQAVAQAWFGFRRLPRDLLSRARPETAAGAAT